ncbi:inorganic polyphosphate/ATP-NAD kinase [Alkalihalobacillus alcalophilus ATCC 27647 = CGMCC 1.3604]|uniref:NAD kinase n=1 Tax=Alkalihalobacillus alcalophilus ATCC 27647 = CGMCC 1.3604 TaxID=1218173 RepID=A0A094WJR9_ALKAL|nr:NAD kinase [Alkalihalobacillus alcalophilus]KGA96183.1 inorganic polyphosphate kinase [Alkalihalobacillus alcalophilus ATCC 27647 = CGMCC 1.3604]MED1561497.1 NAD kinase [Alkalihalobacillus alcalophilus]THG91540.1 inorganic polyphosphate/ATP-NAD kinase [Alkalihalobacillus alcalophilus ATCC 27647 = CGMCC 1.3604]
MSDQNKYYLFSKETETMLQLSEPLKERLNEHGFIPTSTPFEANFILSVGGDNTFLQAVRKTGFRNDCIYIGVNTDDLGFYTDFTLDQLEPLMMAMKEEQLKVRRYPVLKVKIDQKDPFYCLNECTIRSSVIKTFVMDVIIDDQYFETFRGDGMIVSTPTGSTAYNKSVGGAVIDPKLPSMQISEISSLNNSEYRTLGTSFILGSDRSLTLKIVQTGNEHPVIGIDNEALAFPQVKQVHLQLANRYIKVLKLDNNSFWDRVQRKFL